MKNLCARLLVIAVLGVMVAMTGCVYDDTDLVVTESVCVNLDESFTSGSFSTFVVCDLFKQKLMDKLDENDVSIEDVESAYMVNGTFKTPSVAANQHDWTITADVMIARQDDPDGPITDGPAAFVSFTNQSLAALKGKPTDAVLNAAGVDVVNNALEAILNGEDPRLILIVNNESVSPTPSPSDPLELKLLTCVKFQAIINTAE